MSKRILLTDLTEEDKKKIDEELYIEIEPDRKFNKFQPIQYYQLYDVQDNYLFVPFAYNHTKIERKGNKEFTNVKYNFIGTLRPKQVEVKNTSLQHLNKTGSVIISAATAFGKSITAQYIMTIIGKKTAFIVNRVVLLEQWKKSLEKFIDHPKVIIVTTKTKNEDIMEADILLINAINVKKINTKVFEDIGLIVVDEIHQIMSKVLSKCMYSFCPRFVIGLSATPYRSDGLNFLFDHYFGKEKIYIPLYQKHIVYKIETEFTPVPEYTSDGKIIWDSIMKAQATNIERNEKAIKIIKEMKSLVFMILTKRIEHAQFLIDRLKEEGEDVTSLIGTSQTFNETSRILVGSAQKCGVGFDHSRINAMMFIADIRDYFIQYLGRGFRIEDSTPVIFDFVDNNKILKEHFRLRKKVYLECGGEFRDFKSDYPDIKIF